MNIPKSLFFLLLMCLNPFARLDAKTFVSQAITQNTRWLAANSPYIITQDIIVLGNVVLEIEAGVEVFFSVETQLIVEGSIRAIGSKRKPIIFEGLNKKNWNGLWIRRDRTRAYVDSLVQTNVFKYCMFRSTKEAPLYVVRNDGRATQLEFCSFMDGLTAIQAEKHARVSVAKSDFRNCYRPINIRVTSQATIQHNTMNACNMVMLGGTTNFSDNKLCNFTNKGKYSGVVIWMIGGGIVDVQRNTFKNCSGYAFLLQKTSRRTTINLLDNVFKNNVTHLAISCEYINKGKFQVQKNIFTHAEQCQIQLVDNCEEVETDTLQLGTNFWKNNELLSALKSEICYPFPKNNETPAPIHVLFNAVARRRLWE